MNSSSLPADPAMVFIVDDDASVRAALEDLLASVGLQVRSFDSTHAFMAYERPDVPACLVLDIRMPGQSGMDFHRQMQDSGLRLPTIFITGHGDIAMGVEAMKNGAVEFLTKPFRDQELLDAIHMGISQDRQRRAEDRAQQVVRQQWDQLTAGEKEVLHMVLQGMLNKQIAANLGLSEVTIKVRRSQAMRKLNTKTVIDLVRFMEKL